ncbi:hypothetical protein F2Q68_00016526 [Brassica cretica]|uniref:Uncharacterized protein n=1 Tax=Brassica cretica TaxID=69181 RepID=A0A8S9HGX0_BRACR|nr:hypothetical protein F2Q68_00016526 [Brassica cretica]
MLYVCGLVSIDTQVEVLIVALSQMSIDEEELVSIDAARFSFRIVWEDPWIPTTPARPAIPLAPALHPNMRFSDLINLISKEWDVGLLEDYVSPDDIPLIRSLAISSTHRRDTFCWNYTRNGIHNQVWILGGSELIKD